MDIPNIGQGMLLGELYDARTGLSTNISILNNTLPQSLIESRDEPSINTKHITSESYKDKFDVLDVSGNLKVNVLIGLVKVNAQGKYLTPEKTNSKSIKMSMSYGIQTKLDRINIRSDALKEYIDTNTLNNTKATHVVTGIQWGAKMVCSFEHTLKEGESKEEISASLSTTVATIKVGVKVGGSLDTKTEGSSKETSFNLNIVGDIVPQGDEYPTTVEGVVSLLRNIPKSARATNEGKGSVLIYKLEPIESVQQHFGLQSSLDLVVSTIELDMIAKIETIFDTIVENRIRLTEASNDILEYSEFVTEADVKRIKKELRVFGHDEESFKSSLKKIVEAMQCVESKKAAEKDLFELINSFEDGACSSLMVDEVIEGYQPLLRQISFLRFCKKIEIQVIPRDREIAEYLSTEATSKTFVLLIPNPIEYTTAQASDDWHIFNLLKEDNKDAKFLIHDASISPRDPQSIGLTKLTIYKYHGINRSPDGAHRASILRPTVNLSGTKHITQEEVNNLEGNALRMPCPSSHDGDCRCDAIKWFCSKCEEVIQYEYEGIVYCHCGKTPLKNCTFRCDSRAHGYQYKELHALSIQSIREKIKLGDDEINILLLGETGVGKSTFINAFANYLQYSTLEAAERMPMTTLIQSSFDLYNQTVNIGDPDKNEKLAGGQSSTQSCRSYIFPLNDDIKIRLIDTPGIGDTRGVMQDRINFEEIMDYISGFDKINGICILLTPNSSRLSTSFQFCIDELLLHLHKSATNNIIFTFTKTRASFYGAGDTRKPLETYLTRLREERGITIPFEENTRYFFDNESFLFRAALEQGLSFPESIKDDFRKSWDRSVTEAQRMVKRVCELIPHKTSDTTALEVARRLVLILTPPLTGINEYITVEIKKAEALMAETENSEISTADLRKRLKGTYMDLDPIKLNRPRTVCASESCITIFGNTVRYNQHCHDNCTIKNVAANAINHAGLRECGAMDGGNCRICGCRWEKHMHITVDYTEVKKQKVDTEVEKQLEGKESEVKAKQKLVADAKERIKTKKSEKEEIFNALTTFTGFLLQNSILIQNNKVYEYMEMSIGHQVMVAKASGDNSIVESLRKQMKEYKTQTELFEKAIKEGTTQECMITADDVIRARDKLSTMKFNGEIVAKVTDWGKQDQVDSSNRETRIINGHVTDGWRLTRAISNAAKSVVRTVRREREP